MIWLLGVLGYLLGFWYLYVLVMGLYRAHLAGRLTKFTTALAIPALAIGYAVDILSQYTVATIVFRDLPESGEHLVTDRLKRYLAVGKGSRFVKAKWICENLLDPFDPTGKHC